MDFANLAINTQLPAFVAVLDSTCTGR